MILKIFRVLSIFVLCTAGFSEVISPIKPYDYNENKANLGKSLFFDTRLNENNFSEIEIKKILSLYYDEQCHSSINDFFIANPFFKPFNPKFQHELLFY